MTITLTTAGLPPAEQLSYWREAVCDVFTRLDVGVPQAAIQGFEGRIVRHSQGCLDLAEVMVESHSVLRTSQQIRRGDDDTFIALVQRTGQTWIEPDGHLGWLREGERLEAARRALLSASSATRSLTDIAYSVGLKDPAHFSRLFKATCGSSPRDFRAGLSVHQ